MKLPNESWAGSIGLLWATCHIALGFDYQQETVNLARTSIASVEASSVSGARAMDNKYYGVLNAFDDGAGNLTNQISYTFWLGSSHSEWVEVRFAKPVRVRTVVVEDGPQFSAVMSLEDGSRRTCDRVKNVLALEQGVDGVTKLRLSFNDGGGKDSQTVMVREIKVYGNLPIGTQYMAQRPLVVVNEETARLAAAESYNLWREALTKDTKIEIKEENAAYRVIFRREGDRLVMYEAIIDRHTGAVTARPLSDLKPKEPEPEGRIVQPDAAADAAKPRR